VPRTAEADLSMYRTASGEAEVGLTEFNLRADKRSSFLPGLDALEGALDPDGLHLSFLPRRVHPWNVPGANTVDDLVVLDRRERSVLPCWECRRVTGSVSVLGATASGYLACFRSCSINSRDEYLGKVDQNCFKGVKRVCGEEDGGEGFEFALVPVAKEESISLRALS